MSPALLSSRRILRLALPALMMIPAVTACNGSTPSVDHHVVLPGGLVAKTGPALSKDARALSAPSSSSSTSSDSGQCESWTEVSSHFDNATGDFDSTYACAVGGAIERTETVGRDHLDGTGEYTTTYVYRDGSRETWTATWSTAQNGTILTHSVSDRGPVDDSQTRTSTTGASTVHEVYTDQTGTYVSDGVTEADGRWNGTTTFDDPSTSASPDWSVLSHQNADGTFDQSVTGTTEGWAYDYVYAVAADGQADYSFHSDDPTTQVSPDFAGSYHYQADGSGRGSYRQLLDDGSTIDVTDAIHADQSLTESWTYDDPTTTVSPDQSGAIDYAADGTGHGTVTTFVQGGGSQLCDVDVAADGTSTVSNCH